MRRRIRSARRLWLVGIVGLWVGGVSAAQHATPAVQPVHAGSQGKDDSGRTETIAVDGRTYRYGIYVPSSYDPSIAMPVLLCLHGAMFTGSGYLERWVPRLDDKYILVCPTFTPKDSETEIWGHWWSKRAETFVLELLDHLGRQYNIDRNRIVLAGMSNGGVGVYHFAVRYPHLFSAVVPMAGAVPEPDWPRLENLSTPSVYLIHGAEDQVMPVEDTDRAYKALTGKVRDLVYERHEWVHPQAGGHFFPRQALPKLIEWLADKRREPAPKQIRLKLDGQHVGRFFWVGVGDVEQDWSLTAERGGNRIEVECAGAGELTIYLAKEWVDFSLPVTLVVNGEQRHAQRVRPSDELRQKSAAEPISQGDPYDAVITVGLRD